MAQSQREVTELDFRMPQYRDAKPEDYEFDSDGELARKDRFHVGMSDIAHALSLAGFGDGNWCRKYVIKDVVIAVRALCSSVGVMEICRERLRQVGSLGFDSAHDAQYTNNELVKAAICFAVDCVVPVHGVDLKMCRIGSGLWPEGFRLPSDDEKTKREFLARAGALIAAEIDRIDLENEGG